MQNKMTLDQEEMKAVNRNSPTDWEVGKMWGLSDNTTKTTFINMLKDQKKR